MPRLCGQHVGALLAQLRHLRFGLEADPPLDLASLVVGSVELPRDLAREKRGDHKPKSPVQPGGNCNNRTVRGGNWKLSPANVRSATRNLYSADGRDSGLGFRIGRTIATP